MPMAPLLAGLSPGFSREAPLLAVSPVKRPLTAIQVSLLSAEIVAHVFVVNN